jgi:diaminohydroxyphosphoribosylaminopyrimidine deaminase/5-amino-6-(5-phosphoribosylamino)uracil reductase
MRDPVATHSGGIARLEAAGIKVEEGVEREAAEALLEPFVIWQKRAFVLFKLAQTLNGRIGGGYLSSRASLEHVHHLRGVCDRLLIGGNTVRIDRPTLDCRFTAERPPDVTIYSQRNDFDPAIPLFGVEGRQVRVERELEFFGEPSFVLVEGGEGTLRALSKRIDWYLFYQTPKLTTHNLTYNIEQELAFLHSERKGVDMMIWSRERNG